MKRLLMAVLIALMTVVVYPQRVQAQAPIPMDGNNLLNKCEDKGMEKMQCLGYVQGFADGLNLVASGGGGSVFLYSKVRQCRTSSACR
jgi:hypothetical protein